MGLTTYGAVGETYGAVGDTYGGVAAAVIPTMYSPTFATATDITDEQSGFTTASGDRGATSTSVP